MKEEGSHRRAIGAGGRRRFLAALAGSGMAVFAAAGEESAPDGRALLEKWVETKRLICRERQDWRAEKALLEDRIQLMGRETQSLRDSTAQVTNSIGEADQKLAESMAKIAELKTATAGLGEGIVRLEARVQALLKQAPTPIVERVRPLSQRIPQPGQESRMGLSERFQNVVGILNEMNKFSREITVTSEVRGQPDGAKAEVTVIYLGLARAYYCSAASGLAGIGRPGPEGWVWEPRNELAQTVADAVAIHRNEKPAGYVLLPGGVP